MEKKVNEFVKKFKNEVLILLIILGLFIFAVIKVVPQIKKVFSISAEYKTAITTLSERTDSLNKIQEDEKNNKTKENEDVSLKAFYKPIEMGADTESVIAGEFAEILTIIREYSIKTRSIQYTYDPTDDNFVKNAGAKYRVARLDLSMISSYKNFESFLKELYKHEHFIDIESFEIIPYNKDKTILLIKLKIKLYAENN